MEPFIGMIVMFGGNFAPRSWAFCDGQLLPIAQNSALFSILGTTYGGDGRTTFALPDLRGRLPMHPGNGPGLSARRLGERGGQETVTLNLGNLPSHTHPVTSNVSIGVTDEDGTTNEADGKILANTVNNNYSSGVATGQLGGVSNAETTSSPTGNNQAFDIIQPFNCVNFIIALQGIFPSRN